MTVAFYFILGIANTTVEANGTSGVEVYCFPMRFVAILSISCNFAKLNANLSRPLNDIVSSDSIKMTSWKISAKLLMSDF